MSSWIENWLVPPGATAGPGVYAATALAALCLTAVSKGGFGGGVGMLSVPLMLQVAPYRFVVGFWLPVLIACDLATIRAYPKEWNPRAFGKLAPGVLLGVAVTTWWLSTLDPHSPPPELKRQEAWLKLAVALIAAVFLALNFRPKPVDEAPPWSPTWPASVGVGLVTGVTTMLAHAAGSIVTMYFLPMKMEKRVFVGTTGRFFCTFNSLKIPFYVAIGWITWETFRYGLWLMLAAPLGVFFGSWLNRRLNALWFVRLIYVFLALAACKLVYDAWRVLA